MATKASKSNFDVGSQQKAVFRWYEDNKVRDGVNIDEILSMKWQDRIHSWRKVAELALDNLEDADTAIASYEGRAEELEFGVIFVAHPISAFWFWHVLRVCYEIDESICGSTPESLLELETWWSMRPFEYLSSESIKSRWEEELSALFTEIGPGQRRKSYVEQRLFAIAPDALRLKQLCWSVERVFARNIGKDEGAAWMSGRIQAALNERYEIIKKFLSPFTNLGKAVKVDEMKEETTHAESESSSRQTSNESSDSPPLQNSASQRILLTDYPQEERSPAPNPEQSSNNPLLQLQIGILVVRVNSPFASKSESDMWHCQMHMSTALVYFLILFSSVLLAATLIGALFQSHMIDITRAWIWRI